jgi:hypothetical protein
MKFDPNTTTIGEIIDDPVASAALTEVAPPEMQGMPIDGFIRGLTWVPSSMQIKQMVGVEAYNKMVEKLNSL